MSGATCQSRSDEGDLVELVPVVRRIVVARVRDPHLADDLVQETLARVMAARSRVEADTLAPYAAATARNLVASHFQPQGPGPAQGAPARAEEATAPPVDDLIDQEDRRLLAAALDRLPASERDMLVAHEVERPGHEDAGRSAATRRPGAVAAQLGRARAKLRVEYLLLQEHVEPADRPLPSSPPGHLRR